MQRVKNFNYREVATAKLAATTSNRIMYALNAVFNEIDNDCINGESIKKKLKRIFLFFFKLLNSLNLTNKRSHVKIFYILNKTLNQFFNSFFSGWNKLETKIEEQKMKNAIRCFVKIWSFSPKKRRFGPFRQRATTS